MLEEIYDDTGVFQAFDAVSQIPRGSGHNTEISGFLFRLAKEKGWEVRTDKAENIVMVKEASEGMEHLPAVMLQGHMDMVCEKESGSEHDFTKEGLKIFVDGDWIRAEQTTLGADDGIAVAYILALFSDKKLKHPRMEAVITTDEETGMDGAHALDISGLQAKYLLNMDSEEEGVFLTSCAGGLTGVGTIPLKRETLHGDLLKIRLYGLQGGHSGEEIDKNRTNAVSLMGRLLHDLGEKEFRIADVRGGNKDNVIPCEACAELLLTKDCKGAENFVKELVGGYQRELAVSEPGLCIETEMVPDREASVLDRESGENVLKLLYLLPTGVMAMSADMEGLVESSQNLGIFATEKETAVLHVSMRSSKTSAKQYLAGKCRALVELCRGSYKKQAEYPAWEYQKDSALRTYIEKIYEGQFGKKPVMKAIHAGLECGLLAEKMPGLDIVSFGPDTRDIHTPKERLSISSAKRVYAFVKELLENWERL